MEAQPTHPLTIRSRINELSNFLTNSAANSTSHSDNLLQDCVQALQNNVNQFVSDHSDVRSFKDEELDNYMDFLRDELSTTDAQTVSLSKEIESLKKSYMEGTCQLEGNLESLRHLVEHIGLEGPGLANTIEHIDKLKSGGQPEAKALHDDYIEVLKLKHQIEMNNMTLKSMQDLDLDLRRIEAIDYIEEALTGLKVIDFEGNTIRVSLKTYIPNVDGVMCQLNAENNIKQSEVNHELLIEVVDGTMDIKNVEIFPNDVYIGEIAEAANTFSKLFTAFPVPRTRSSLGWFLQKVQDKIAMYTIRQLVVKSANKGRHSFEYLDKDELISAHISGVVDAFIKPCAGWPLFSSPLKLVFLRSSNQITKEISLGMISKVEEMANSFDLDKRKSLTTFVDGIEEIIMEKMRLESHLKYSSSNTIAS